MTYEVSIGLDFRREIQVGSTYSASPAGGQIRMRMLTKEVSAEKRTED